MINENIQVEVPTDHGRIDVVIDLKNQFYLIELKINSTPEIALKQIEDNKYYQKYLHLKSQ